MTERKLKNGRSIITEFETRDIDVNGDAINVFHSETQIEATRWADKLLKEGSVAVVVERHISRYPRHMWEEANSFKTIFTGGNEEALKVGGWLDD